MAKKGWKLTKAQKAKLRAGVAAYHANKQREQAQLAPDTSVLTVAEKPSRQDNEGRTYGEWVLTNFKGKSKNVCMTRERLVHMLNNAHKLGMEEHSKWSAGVQEALRQEIKGLKEELRETRKSFVHSLTLNDLLLEKHGYAR